MMSPVFVSVVAALGLSAIATAEPARNHSEAKAAKCVGVSVLYLDEDIRPYYIHMNLILTTVRLPRRRLFESNL